MKYYLIVGEASGDLHASHLMRALKKEDPEAEFRFFGGDLMAAEGGTLVRHYRELAYMGFVPVLMHLPTILKAQKAVVKDIRQWQPNVVILVDYPGFNLRVAKNLSRREERGKRRENSSVRGEKGNLSPLTPHPSPQIYYYISPKIWAWKEWRIKSIRRYVDEMFSILPFEVDFYENKHHYPIHYVGNPTADEVREFMKINNRGCEGTVVRGGEKCDEANLLPSHPRTLAPPKTIALLAGSRRQEIKDNLPTMLKAASVYPTYQLVVAGAPGIEASYYEPFLREYKVDIVFGQTYDLLSKATMAIVTSGTATLETALFGVPQVVCYKTPVPKLIRFAFNHIIKCKYISLVNLIADEEVVPELMADRFSVKEIRKELRRLQPHKKARERMLQGYERVRQALGDRKAPEEAARIMVSLLRKAEC